MSYRYTYEGEPSAELVALTEAAEALVRQADAYRTVLQDLGLTVKLPEGEYEIARVVKAGE